LTLDEAVLECRQKESIYSWTDQSTFQLVLFLLQTRWVLRRWVAAHEGGQSFPVLLELEETNGEGGPGGPGGPDTSAFRQRTPEPSASHLERDSS
jgi:hypothetical protein